MSYSVSFVGSADKVVDLLTDYSNKTSGQSKIEYDSALPHILAIVKLNSPGITESIAAVKVSAYGHSTTNGEEVVSSSCSVTVERIYGFAS